MQTQILSRLTRPAHSCLCPRRGGLPALWCRWQSPTALVHQQRRLCATATTAAKPWQHDSGSSGDGNNNNGNIGGGWDPSQLAGTLAGLVVFPILCYYVLKAGGVFDMPPPPPPQQKEDAEDNDDADMLVGDTKLVQKVSLGGPFEMTDCQTGKRVTDQDLLPGKWTMLYFGFTRCAEICPSTMRFMQSMYDTAKESFKGQYDDEVSKMQILFVSVDHIRDKPADLEAFLKKYATTVPARGVVPLTREDVENVTRPWRVYISSVDETEEEREAREAKGIAAPDPTSETYQLDHSAAIYFVGPDGKLKDFFFKEIPLEQAVDRMSLHFENVYGLGK